MHCTQMEKKAYTDTITPPPTTPTTNYFVQESLRRIVQYSLTHSDIELWAWPVKCEPLYCRVLQYITVSDSDSWDST